jgi:hypothetical protein
MDIWPTVHAERKALADDLRNLGTEEWASPRCAAIGRSATCWPT